MVAYLEFAVASNFSFLRGASHPEELMLQAAHVGLEGLGLCDRNSVAGVVRAHLVKREKKLTLAYHPGARLVFADGTPDILAYPRDRPAWGRLCGLLTRGNLRAQKGDCILYYDDLLDHVDGLELVVMEASTWELSSLPLLRRSASLPAPMQAEAAGLAPMHTQAGQARQLGTQQVPNSTARTPACRQCREKAICENQPVPLAAARSRTRARAACGQHALSRQ